VFCTRLRDGASIILRVDRCTTVGLEDEHVVLVVLVVVRVTDEVDRVSIREESWECSDVPTGVQVGTTLLWRSVFVSSHRLV